MQDLTAVIIAAGRGTRMGPDMRERPKGLLTLGPERLVERSVRLLRAAGIGRVRLVTGHLSEQFEALERAGDLPVELIHNPAFATTGSLRSLMTGLDGLSGPLLILESDIIYEARALRATTARPDCMVLSGPTGAGDEVYTWTRPGPDGSACLLAMSKDPAALPQPHLGELVGIIALSAEGAAHLRTTGEQMLRDTPKTDYEPAIVSLAQGHAIACRLIPDLAWSEIDTPDMYVHARDMVWPRIAAADALTR